MHVSSGYKIKRYYGISAGQKSEYFKSTRYNSEVILTAEMLHF